MGKGEEFEHMAGIHIAGVGEVCIECATDDEAYRVTIEDTLYRPDPDAQTSFLRTCARCKGQFNSK
jgi:hypothetical protein